MTDRIDLWLSHCPDPETDPLPGMREAGLLEPAPDYAAIARTKAAIVERTGLLGVASVWGGRHLVARHFLSFGTDAQRAAWQDRALAVAISEPKVGAHPKLLTTRADPTETGYRITGQKAWVTNGPSADAIIVFAITAEDAGRKRYSALIVPRDTQGLTTEDMPGFHALRPSKHCLLTLDGCEVPGDAMLGSPGSAYDRMALPFRDIEDAVGTFGTLGALRHAVGQFAGASFAGAEARQTEDLGAIVALTTVFAAGAEAVVTALDAGRFRTGDATLVGLRVLAIDIVARLRALANIGPNVPTTPTAATATATPANGAAAAAAVPDSPPTVMAGEGPPSTPAPNSEPPGTDPTPAAANRLREILSDLDATLNIARGPRLARQAHLGAAALRRS